MHCSLFDVEFCHDKLGFICSRIRSKVPAPQKPEVEIPTTKTAIHPGSLREVPAPLPLEDGNGMK